MVLLRLDPEARARSPIVRVPLWEELPREYDEYKYSKLIVGEWAGKIDVRRRRREMEKSQPPHAWPPTGESCSAFITSSPPPDTSGTTATVPTP